MNVVVVDASTTLAWCFPDETSEQAESVLASLGETSILVPSIWVLEVANAISVAERGKRLGSPEIQQFITLLESLDLVQDLLPVGACVRSLLPIVREHGLSAYDAAYLELSMRRGAPLATLDRKLQKAARKAGVKIFTGAS